MRTGRQVDGARRVRQEMCRLDIAAEARALLLDGLTRVATAESQNRRHCAMYASHVSDAYNRKGKPSQS